MNKSLKPGLILLAAALTACGSTDFEWFPKVNDTTPPVISLTGPTFRNNSGHATLNTTVVSFSADEPAMIYYTTSATAAESAFTSLDFSTTPVVGFTITAANTILRFFGIDKSPNLNKSTVQSVTIISP